MIDLLPVGTSGLAVAPLVLGGNVFGWTARDQKVNFAVLDAFVGGGGTMIDTADAYSVFVPGNRGGESESVLGEWLHSRGRRAAVQIATKVGALAGEGGTGLAPKRILAALEASLRRLQTDYVDLYYAHVDDPNTPLEAVLETFDRLVSEGKVRAIAASNFAADRLAASLRTSESLSLQRYQALQPPYNLLERGKYEGDLQRVCIENGIAVFPYFGLASGFLTGKYRTEEDVRGGRAMAVGKYMNSRGLAVLSALDEITAATGATPAQISLAWRRKQPGVTAPIASATSVQQVEEALGSMRLELSAEQLATLAAA